MRSLVVLTSVLSALALSNAHAQSGPAPDATRAPTDLGSPSVEPSSPPGSSTSAGEPPSTSSTTTAPAAEPVAPASPTAAELTARDAATLESQLAAPRTASVPPGAVGEQAAAAPDRRAQLADAWVAFEAERDRRTRKAEQVFYPLMLGGEAALGIAFAVGAKDVTNTSRVLAGVTAGLTLGAMVPTIVSRSRSGKRAWFTAGAALFALGAGATIATAADNDSRDRSARWAGASVALQGLALLPIALIPGFPEESEYEAYRRLPESERPAAAARILTRIDHFEQRVTAISLFGALSSAVVLAAGALVSDNHDQSRTLAGLSIIPIGTVLAVFAPRLFVRNRNDRYSVGEAPTKLPFNGW
jgi:hypothetical protein